VNVVNVVNVVVNVVNVVNVVVNVVVVFHEHLFILTYSFIDSFVKVGDIIVFDDMHIHGVGNAEGERIQIDFSLYSLIGNNPVLLAQKRSPPITVFNHSQYLPGIISFITIPYFIQYHYH
jgi:hypothetical protein